MNYKQATVNHAPPYVGERGNHLCLAQKHTENTSCILSTTIARPSYALRLSTHGVTGGDELLMHIAEGREGYSQAPEVEDYERFFAEKLT